MKQKQPVFTRRIHEVEMHQVINAQLFQLQHHCTQVGPQNFRICVVLHFSLISLLSVKSETLARAGTAGTTCSLLRTGF